MSDSSRNVVIKRAPNGVLFADYRFRLENVPITYARLQAPKASTLKNEDGTTAAPKYSATILVPKRTHTPAKDLVKDAILKCLQDNNGGQPIAMSNWFLQNGDHAAAPHKKGFFTMNLASNADYPPALRWLDQRGAMDRAGADAKFYDGALVDVVGTCWFYGGNAAKRIAKRVSANLLAVRMVDNTVPRMATGSGGLTETEVDDAFDWGTETATGLHDVDEV